MTKDEALKLALEYLKANKPKISEGSLPVLLHNEIIAIIKTQLEVIDEPLASVSYFPCCTDQTCPKCKAAIKPELVCVCGAVWEGQELIYTTPQRTWVGLTDEELPPLVGDNGKYMELQQVRRFYKAIEAKLKEKNT